MSFMSYPRKLGTTNVLHISSNDIIEKSITNHEIYSLR